MEKKRDNKTNVQELEIEISKETAADENEVTSHNFLQKCKKILNPPIVATLVAIPLALIPYIKAAVFSGSGAILQDNVMKAVQMMGGCASPFITIILGYNLSNGYPRTANISK